jgi:hypothetical protein
MVYTIVVDEVNAIIVALGLKRSLQDLTASISHLRFWHLPCLLGVCVRAAL